MYPTKKKGTRVFEQKLVYIYEGGIPVGKERHRLVNKSTSPLAQE